MKAERMILVPLDGSPEAEGVLPLALQVAREQRAQLTLFRAARSPAGLREACRYLEAFQESPPFRRIPNDIVAAVGNPGEEIPRLAAVRSADLVAMTTHGRSGLRRTLMGSVAGEIVRHSPIPILLHRPGQSAHPLARIVVTLDGSEESAQILPTAAAFSVLHGATLHVLGVGRRGNPLDPLKTACQELRRRGAIVIPVVRSGRPAPEIAKYAAEIEAGLIMLSTHGLGGFSRALFGSVSDEVVHSAMVPVLVQRMTAVAVAES